MSFVFEIATVSEINRDPAGHHRHWAVLQGHLAAGEVQRGSPLLLTTGTGEEFAARVLAFDTSGGRAFGDSLTAADAPAQLGLISYLPAVPQDTKLVQARDCSEEDRERVMISMLGRAPQLFFHHVAGTEQVCADCARALRTVGAQVRPLMLGLAERTTGPLAKMIRAELARTRPA